MIWGTPVSGLQFFGYGLALSGLIYYKLGAEQLKGYLHQGVQRWAEFGAQSPNLRRVVTLGLVVVTIMALFGGLAPASTISRTNLSFKSP